MFAPGRPGSTPFEDLLVDLASGVLAGCLVWATLICLTAVVEALSRGRLRATRWVGCPAVLRRLLLGGLGVALAASPAPAIAGVSAPQRQGSTPGHGLPVPARTVSSEPAPPPTRVVVRAGDCLWSLARSQLPPGAATARVAAAVEALYRRNRQVIGDDPDLLRPGDQLVWPHTVRHLRSEETR